jgi:hypothetical protein
MATLLWTLLSWLTLLNKTNPNGGHRYGPMPIFDRHGVGTIIGISSES